MQQPYSWLFRLGDITAALLLLLAVWYIHKKSPATIGRFYPVLVLIGLMLLIDPLATTSCVQTGKQCIETVTLSSYIHGAETVILATLVIGLSGYDAFKRKHLTSTLFVIFQIAYIVLFLTGLAKTFSFATLSQYLYQLLLLLWLAWFVGNLASSARTQSEKAKKYVRRLFASWAYLNGVLAIAVSLLHIHLFGFLRSVYFAGNTAWLAQHGVLVGVAMLYVSWHLWRGEHRARQLFLVLLFVEVLKYSVISPNAWLLGLYGLTFAILFASRQFFTRGAVNLSWHARIQEVGVIAAGVAAISAILLFALSLSPRRFGVVKEAFRDFTGFVVTYNQTPRHLLRSSLLAHTVTALLFATLLFVLWSLFRPSKKNLGTATDSDREHALQLLDVYSTSSEDYFKLWPTDKNYYWSEHRAAFIAYRVAKSVVFALADPIGPRTAQQELLESFTGDWNARGYRVCFLLVPETSLHLYEAAQLHSMQIGSNALVNVAEFSQTTIRNKWWRWQVNRATKAGYTYHTSSPPHDTALLRQLQHVSDAWLTRPGRQEQGFAMGSFSTAYMQDCVLHYLRDASGHVVAFANQIPVFNNQRQTTIDLMRFTPDADNTMPFLLARAIEGLALQSQYTHFDLGFVPLANMEGRLVSIAKFAGSQRFSAAGLEQFKKKFEPTWHKCYVAYDGDIADLAVIALNVEDAMKTET